MANSVADSLFHRVAHQDLLLNQIQARVDSLTHTLTVREQLLFHVAGRRDPLGSVVPSLGRDTTWIGLVGGHQNGDITTKDVIGWLVTLVGIGIAATVAIRGWRKAERTASNAQDQRRRIEENWRKERLILRIRGALETTAVTVRATLKKPHTRPINPETMNSILVEWERYDRV